VEWSGIHGLHLDSMDSRWIPGGFQVELEKYLAGLPAKEIPPGIYGGV